MSQRKQNKRIKVYEIGGGGWGCIRFIKNAVEVNRVEDADVVILPGGADINPSIYHKAKHYSTHFIEQRDEMELREFGKVREDQLVLGICRGAQLVCALYGGILVQNCNHHAGCSHEITDGEHRYYISSLHHQMMYPFDLPQEDYEILYKSSERRSTVYEGDGVDENKIIENGEPEIVLFHRPGMPTCLAVQGHPEMMEGSPVSNMISDLLTSYLNEQGK